MSDTPAAGSPAADSAPGLPVTVVLSRRPQPGREDELVAWAHGISEVAGTFPGHLGAVVYPPNPPECEDLVLAFSFANAEQLSTWERSDVRRDWLDRARPLVAGETRAAHAASGFEGIFSHPPGQAVTPPPRWKTAAIIALALYPVSLLLNWLLGPHIATWIIWLRVLLNVAIIVPYMAWVGVPYLTKWLRGWLHP